MSRSDMMPLWTDAYLADTQDLDAIQHGMYFLLIMRAWRSGEARLRDDERALSNIARVSLAQWRKHSPAIMEYWTLKDGYWTQKRLVELWKTRTNFIDEQRARGNNSARNAKNFQKCIVKKPNENKETGTTNAVAVAVADYNPPISPAKPSDGYASREENERLFKLLLEKVDGLVPRGRIDPLKAKREFLIAHRSRDPEKVIDAIARFYRSPEIAENEDRFKPSLHKVISAKKYEVFLGMTDAEKMTAGERRMAYHLRDLKEQEAIA